MIKAKLDVTKIDKSKIFVGAKGKYIDICLIEKNPPDQYGNDYMVVQDVSKEERLKGVRGAILGNAKIIGSGARPGPRDITPRDDVTSAPKAPPAGMDDDSIPF